MQKQLKPVFLPGKILLPFDEASLAAWAVLACDQFTSQEQYWQDAKAAAQNLPSTYNIILPEVYLEAEDVQAKIQQIHRCMAEYKKAVLTKKVNGFVYLRRQMQNGSLREGIVGCVDLEEYSFAPGESPRIRPSEGTIVQRIPPRLAVRRGALLETPHILMLINDPNKTVIEPFAKKTASLPQLYNFNLMLGGGIIAAWAVEDAKDVQSITDAVLQLEKSEAFNQQYQTGGLAQPFALAAGDGNHSLATAKAYWQEVKAGLPEEERHSHPARFCLVELENIQSPAIEIKPIHRVVFGASPAQLLAFMGQRATVLGCKIGPGQAGQSFCLLAGGGQNHFCIAAPPAPLTVGSIDALIDGVEQALPGCWVDYIHGEKDLRALAAQGAVGILLPNFEKEDLFKGIALGGVLPRKTFSMGRAKEKRYYLECRQITKD